MDNPCGSCVDCCSHFGEAGLPLYPSEVRKVKESAKKMGIKIQSQARAFVSDSVSGLNIIEEYRVLNRPCAFLSSGCKIYADRPLVCRAYPYHFSREGTWSFGKCREIEKIKEHKDPHWLGAARECVTRGSEVANRLIDLDRNGKIRLGDAIPGAECVDADEFLERFRE